MLVSVSVVLIPEITCCALFSWAITLSSSLTWLTCVVKHRENSQRYFPSVGSGEEKKSAETRRSLNCQKSVHEGSDPLRNGTVGRVIGVVKKLTVEFPSFVSLTHLYTTVTKPCCLCPGLASPFLPYLINPIWFEFSNPAYANLPHEFLTVFLKISINLLFQL